MNVVNCVLLSIIFILILLVAVGMFILGITGIMDWRHDSDDDDCGSGSCGIPD